MNTSRCAKVVEATNGDTVVVVVVVFVFVLIVGRSNFQRRSPHPNNLVVGDLNDFVASR